MPKVYQTEKKPVIQLLAVMLWGWFWKDHALLGMFFPCYYGKIESDMNRQSHELKKKAGITPQ